MKRPLAFYTLSFLLIPILAHSQQMNPAPTAAVPTSTPTLSTGVTTQSDPNDLQKPNTIPRLKRNLNLIVGIPHDEEFRLPDVKLSFRGVDFDKMFEGEIKRLQNTDIFRMTPKAPGKGIFTIQNSLTKQLLAEVRYEIREPQLDLTLREVQSLLGDIEGIEYKLVNGKILLDGYALLPRDLIRIGNVIKQFDGQVKSLVTLSPVARKRIFEFITRDVNNPEVSITPIGDFIKLEGVVNSQAERDRIKSIIRIYWPDIVTDKVDGAFDHISIEGRSKAKSLDDLIMDLTTIRKDEEKTEPPPKMIQVVVHFVQFFEDYGKGFDFVFNPTISTLAPNAPAPTGPTSTLTDTANLISNLLPKLQWAKKHGNARILDTASILTQDKLQGSYANTITIQTQLPGPNGSVQSIPNTATVNVTVTPIIKSERSGLIELNKLSVLVSDVRNNGATSVSNNVNTTISVRDRWSAAFAGIIKKKTANEYGGNPATGGSTSTGGASGSGGGGAADPIVTFRARKAYDKGTSNFVVFVTPIIKSSASSGVEQVKKKFRLRD